MSREDAIKQIVSIWLQCDGEFCCSNEEREGSKEELKESLKALGVTEDEIAKEV